MVVDRYWLSTLAYAPLRGRCLPMFTVESTLVRADMTFFLDLIDVERRARLIRRGVTSADMYSMLPRVAFEVRMGFLKGMQRPIAGVGVHLDMNGLSPEAARDAVLSRIVKQPHPGPSRSSLAPTPWSKPSSVQ
mgnify:CR=1 FL=1